MQLCWTHIEPKEHIDPQKDRYKKRSRTQKKRGSVRHFFLDLPLDEDEGEGCRIALLLGPHTLVAAVRKSGRVLVLKTLSSLWRDLYIDVLQRKPTFYRTIQLRTNWSANWGLGLIMAKWQLCTCKDLLRTANTLQQRYLCSFTVVRPVQNLAGYVGPGIIIFTRASAQKENHLRSLVKAPSYSRPQLNLLLSSRSSFSAQSRPRSILMLVSG